MARIIQKSDHQQRELEELINGTPEQQEQVAQTKKNMGVALIVGMGIFLLGALLVMLRVNAGAYVLFGGLFVLMIGGLGTAFAGYYPDRNKINQIQAGIDGENRTAQVVEVLPDSYVVYRNIYIPGTDRNGNPESYEFDMIVVGNSGVTIVETKNYSGYLRGHVDDRELSRLRISRYDVEREDVQPNPLRQIGRQFAILRGYLEGQGFRNCLDSALYMPNPDTEMELEGQTRVGLFLEGQDGAEKLRQFILTRNRHLTDAAVWKICELFDALETPSYDSFR